MIHSRIAAILAGGKSARMGGDKALAIFLGRRLVDIVAARLRPQADALLISGPTNYGLDIECAPDAADAPPGPAAGVFTVARRLSLKRDGPDGFVTAPVDGPNLPDDLVERLLRGGGCAVAADGEHVHPTFAYWTIAALQATEPAFRASGSPSLLRLAELTGAVRVVWPNAAAFANINNHEDLERLTLDAPHTPASD